MLEEVKKATNKPKDIIIKLSCYLKNHTTEKVNEFCNEVLEFIKFTEKTVDWLAIFKETASKIG